MRQTAAIPEDMIVTFIGVGGHADSSILNLVQSASRVLVSSGVTTEMTTSLIMLITIA